MSRISTVHVLKHKNTLAIAVAAMLPRQDERASNSRVASESPDALRSIEHFTFSKSFYTRQEIYGRGDPAEHWYQIAFGAARKCAVLADGRRRIVDFLLPGDVFGFGTHHSHRFSVEAIIDGTIVLCYLRRQVQLLVESEPRLAEQILEMTFEALSRSQTRMLTLGLTTAREKVVSFLIEMERRSSGNPGETFVLPMSRYDIGDYLAISAETVSRALTDLTRRGCIAFAGKHRVKIMDHRLLKNGFGADAASGGPP
jgi:CRP/FNR family transcriptional regulator, nitrogen fixation regulation protein